MLPFLLICASFLAGCPGTQTQVGALCQKNADCTNETRPQVCAQMPPADGAKAEAQPRICTRACKSRTECPVGYECVASAEQGFTGMKYCFPCRADYDCPAGTYCLADAGADGGAAGKTCQAKNVAKEDFGKSCAVMEDAACNKAKGFICHRELDSDPDAYCTKECKTDVECPADMFCGTPTEGNIPSGTRKRCFLRQLCASCRSDAECSGQGAVCVPDDRGRGYCTRTCNPASSSPCTALAAGRGFLECAEVVKDPSKPDEVVNACVHRYGRCYGEGKVCDPCRQHMPEDCKKVSGRQCYQNERGESFCLQVDCTSTEDCEENERLSVPATCRTFGRNKICSSSASSLTCWP